MLRLSGNDLNLVANQIETPAAFDDKLPGIRSPREILAHIADSYRLCAHLLRGGTDEGWRPLEAADHPDLAGWLTRVERERADLLEAIDGLPEQRLGEKTLAWSNAAEEKQEMSVAQMILMYGPIHEAWHTGQLALLLDLRAGENA